MAEATDRFGPSLEPDPPSVVRTNPVPEVTAAATASPGPAKTGPTVRTTQVMDSPAVGETALQLKSESSADKSKSKTYR